MRTKEQKQASVQYGERAERFIVNKINNLNNTDYTASVIDEILDEKRSPYINHIEGDIYIIKNEKTYKVDIKSSIKYPYPVINIDYKQNGNVVLKMQKFLSEIHHDYYIGVGYFNNDEFDMEQRANYILLKTSDFKHIMLDDPEYTFVRLNYKCGTESDYIRIDAFKDVAPSYFESDNIEEILKRIE